jgi:hypothetical protein
VLLEDSLFSSRPVRLRDEAPESAAASLLSLDGTAHRHGRELLVSALGEWLATHDAPALVTEVLHGLGPAVANAEPG